jgi:hypothetical protein
LGSRLSALAHRHWPSALRDIDRNPARLVAGEQLGRQRVKASYSEATADNLILWIGDIGVIRVSAMPWAIFGVPRP